MIQQLNLLLASEFDPGFAARAQFIFDTLDKNKSQKVLDAGCGRGFYSHAFSFFPFVTEIQSFDINESYVKRAKSHCTDKRIHIKKASIYELPYPDGYFDFIVFSEVLEHLVDEKKALQELRRVLKKNGVIALTVPDVQFPFLWDPLNWLLMRLFKTHISKDIWWLAGIWADHERLYSLKELKKTIEVNSFKIDRVERVVHWSWPFAHFILYGIGKNLIERLGLEMGNRFSYTKKNGVMLALASIMKAPSTYLDSTLPLSASVNICALLKK